MQRVKDRILWALGPAIFLILFFVVPMGTLIVYAFGLEGAREPGAALREILDSPYHRNRILFTYQQALLSTFLTFVLAIPIAYLFATKHVPGRGTLRTILIVPFVLPALVVALGFESFLGQASPLSRLLGIDLLALVGPLGAILLAHTFYNVGLVARLVGGFWERVPHELLDAARNLGASRTAAVTRVLLPLGVPAMVSAAALVFLFCASSFGIILLLGAGQVGTIETLIAEEARSINADFDVASALGLLQLATTLAAVLVYLVLQRRLAVWFRPRLDVRRERMPAWGWFAIAPALLLVIGPILALVYASLRYAGGWSIQGYRLLFSDTVPLGAYGSQAVFLNSLRFGLLTLLIAVPLAFLTARAFRHVALRYSLLEAFFLAPLGSSAVLLGLGFTLAFDGTFLPDLRASSARIALAHALVAIPFASRVLSPSLDAVDPGLRAAARTLGASSWRVFRLIELPLLRPAAAAATLFAFATSLGEFGATFVLRRPEFTTIPLAIFDAYGRPGEVFRAQAEALSVLLLLVAFGAFALIERRRVRQEFA